MKNASPLMVHDAGRGRKQEEGAERKGYHLTSTPLNSSSIDKLNQVQSTPVIPFSTDSAPFHKVGPTRMINVAPQQLSSSEYDVKRGEALLPRGQLKLELEITEMQSPASGVAPRGKTVKGIEGGTGRVEADGLSPIRGLPDITLESESDQLSRETSLSDSPQLQSTDVMVAPSSPFQHDKRPAPILLAKSRLTSEGASSLSPLLSPHLLSSLLLSETLDRTGPSKPCLQTSCKSLAILSEERLHCTCSLVDL